MTVNRELRLPNSKEKPVDPSTANAINVRFKVAAEHRIGAEGNVVVESSTRRRRRLRYPTTYRTTLRLESQTIGGTNTFGRNFKERARRVLQARLVALEFFSF